MTQIFWRSPNESVANPVSEFDPLPVQIIQTPISIASASTSSVVAASNLEQITVAATSVGLTTTRYAPIGFPGADIYVETAPVRVRWDGNSPTAALGLLMTPGDRLAIYTAADLDNFRAIATTGTSATLTVVYYSGSAVPQRAWLYRGFPSDSAGNVNMNQNTLFAGEDTTVGVLKTEQRFGYTNIIAAAPTTTVVKNGAGMLHCVTFNKPVATNTTQLFDNTAASGTSIALITIPASPMQTTFLYDVTFATGLTVLSSTAACDVTVSWR